MTNNSQQPGTDDQSGAKINQKKDTGLFLNALGIGYQGELKALDHLKGRAFWGVKNTSHEPDNWGTVVCKAQIWLDKTREYANNKDFEVRLDKACKDCQHNDCEYYKIKPYKEPFTEIHEVKTNAKAHMGDDRTLNIFIEYEQGKGEGWFMKEPHPEWYHFYQPMKRWTNEYSLKYQDSLAKGLYIEPPIESEYISEIDQEDKAKQEEIKHFKANMGTNDILITEWPCGYFLSITHKKLMAIEPRVRENRDKTTKAIMAPSIQIDAKTGREYRALGTMIRTDKILNNTSYYNTQNDKKKEDICYTPVYEEVRGENEAKTKQDSIRYIMKRIKDKYTKSNLLWLTPKQFIKKFNYPPRRDESGKLVDHGVSAYYTENGKLVEYRDSQGKLVMAVLLEPMREQISTFKDYEIPETH